MLMETLTWHTSDTRMQVYGRYFNGGCGQVDYKGVARNVQYLWQFISLTWNTYSTTNPNVMDWNEVPV